MHSGVALIVESRRWSVPNDGNRTVDLHATVGMGLDGDQTERTRHCCPDPFEITEVRRDANRGEPGRSRLHTKHMLDEIA